MLTWILALVALTTAIYAEVRYGRGLCFRGIRNLLHIRDRGWLDVGSRNRNQGFKRMNSDPSLTGPIRHPRQRF
jgi:hypothetical protein